MFLRDLLQALSGAGCRTCVVGGVAVNLHGIPRMTFDVDLVALPEVENLRRVEAVLHGLGLTRRQPIQLEAFADGAFAREMREERNLLAVTYTDLRAPLREVDVLVSPPIEPAELIARAIPMHLGALEVLVASAPDLIRMKRASGRPQDEADARHLERLLGAEGT